MGVVIGCILVMEIFTIDGCDLLSNEGSEIM